MEKPVRKTNTYCTRCRKTTRHEIKEGSQAETCLKCGESKPVKSS